MQEQKKQPPKKKIVKLYVYQKQNEKTIIDTFEREEFDDFILVSGNFSDSDNNSLEELHSQVSGSTDKTVLLVDKSADLTFYGVRELEKEND